MRAICIPANGNAGELTLMDVPVPLMDANEALVMIRAIGVGSHDRWARPDGVQFPYVIGLEAAGVIADVGGNVNGFHPGDRVMIQGIHEKGGTWAEYAAVSAEALIPMPDGLSFNDAAAIPVAGSTALEAISALDLKSGNTLFVAGASGAIGTLAVQLAAQRGWRIAASASPDNHDYLRSLGVELTVDYRDPAWAEQIRAWAPGGGDAALAIQRGTGAGSIGVVRQGGKLVTVSGDQFEGERDVTIEQIVHHPETKTRLIELATQIATGQIRIVVEHAYPFAQAVAALEKVESRHARGKTILTLD